MIELAAVAVIVAAVRGHTRPRLAGVRPARATAAHRRAYHAHVSISPSLGWTETADPLLPPLRQSLERLTRPAE